MAAVSSIANAISPKLTADLSLFNYSFVTNSSQLNQTHPSTTVDAVNWETGVQITLTGFAISSLFSGVVIDLYIFARHRSIRTPFNTYIIFVLLSELAVLTLAVLFIVRPYDYKQLLNPGLCCFCLTLFYMGWIGVQNVEVLIAVNRLWACLFPHHYRLHHTRRLALLLCLAVNIVNGLLLLPFVPWPVVSRVLKRCTGNLESVPSYSKFVAAYLSAPLFCLLSIYRVF
ncbi:hypothetical protein RvY_17248 [Ramazzottius varieornatus]|uniref:G-protein coupled receptors family 1 profile domain-containing protein n=1 Tax=Ramazzottius varieornatus TaxID=947166 RepID=A0A1D1W1V5_RAMVA|nr:hypothetical protein RvY_17248 [Ramazzottius varieornatus]